MQYLFLNLPLLNPTLQPHGKCCLGRHFYNDVQDRMHSPLPRLVHIDVDCHPYSSLNE